MAENETREAFRAWSKADEWNGIYTYPPGTPATRAPMSKPPHVIASASFIAEVSDMLERDLDRHEIADWIVDKMERFGAAFAEPMFTTDGTGPICSWCKTIWPLCGHHHDSIRLAELDVEPQYPRRTDR